MTEIILQKMEETSDQLKMQEDYYQSILNILDDSHLEKEELQQLQQASLNILKDFEEERERLEQTHRAVINILDDIEAAYQKEKQEKIILEITLKENKELDAFCYSVSHDLQAPLRAISGFAQIVVEDYSKQLDSEGQRYLRLIQENSYLMSQLIRDLLEFSHLGRQEINLTAINMDHLAKEVYEDLKSQTPDRTILFKLNFLPEAFGDLSMIRQVFVNLLSNALKFTEHREVTVIEMGYRQEGKEGVYYIKDNGVGFDMRYVDKLFGVFQRLHSVEEFKGTGIGLALVNRIITRHKGRTWAEGTVNQGACFYFTLYRS